MKCSRTGRPLEGSKLYAVAAIPYDSQKKVERGILRAASIGADLVELRLDYWKGAMPDFGDQVNLARTYGMDVIVTVRDPSEGGVRRVEWKERALRLAKDLNCLCDVEAKLYSEPPCERTIASIHFFNELKEEDYKLITELSSQRSNFSIFKVAAKLRDVEDLLRLVRSIRHPKKAFMPMGEGTEKLRLISVLLGSHLNYGSVSEATAPGQVRLDLIVKALEVSRKADELYSPERV